jgi:hypothetical protein
MKNVCKWKVVKDFVNSHEIFTRRELRIKLNIRSIGDYTESQYINHIKNAGFIKRIERGKYKRIMKIPKSISSTKIANIGYMSKEEKQKILLVLIRKEKLQNINNI